MKSLLLIAAVFSLTSVAQAGDPRNQGRTCKVDAPSSLSCGCIGQNETCTASLNSGGMVSVSLTSSASPVESTATGYMAAKTELQAPGYKGSPAVNASCQCELK